MVTVPVNENAQMDVDALEKNPWRIYRLKVKLLLVSLRLQGQTDAGAIDPLKKVREITNKYGAVDAYRRSVGWCT